MSLHKLLTDNRLQIVDRSREKVRQFTDLSAKGGQVDAVLDELYQELIEVFSDPSESYRALHQSKSGESSPAAVDSEKRRAASLRLSFSISSIVHSYSSIFQAITEYARETNASISPEEFSRLNRCLDAAIAKAVAEFDALGREHADAREQSERLHLGFLVHEIRNSLANAMMAQELIHSGQVIPSGEISFMLSKSLVTMKDIIDRAMAEVRLDSQPSVDLVPMSVLSLVSELEISANFEANAKVVSLAVDVDPGLNVKVDRHLMASALSNIIQNAIKYSPQGSTIRVSAYVEGENTVIDVEDQCGGLPAGKIAKMFEPFNQLGKDRSGLGLGLSIAQRAIGLNNGTLEVRDIPGSGCVFSIRVPLNHPSLN